MNSVTIPSEKDKKQREYIFNYEISSNLFMGLLVSVVEISFSPIEIVSEVLFAFKYEKLVLIG